jgi:hypothetical protein
VRFGGAIGQVNALSSLSVTSTAASTILTGSVSTTGAQTFTNKITLAANTNFTGSSFSFASTGVQVDGVAGTNYSSGIYFSDVGTYTNPTIDGAKFINLGTFTTGATAPISLTGAFTTTGAQTYNAPIRLTGVTTLTTTNSPLTFNSTLDGGSQLTLNAGTAGAAAVNIYGAFGGTTAVGALVVTGPTTLGHNVTSGAQTWNSPITILDNNATVGTKTLTASGAVTLNGTVNGSSVLLPAENLTIANAANVVNLNATIGLARPSSNFSITGTGQITMIGSVANTVTTSQDQNYGGAVVLIGTTNPTTTLAVTAAGAQVKFTSTVNATTSGVQGLTINNIAGNPVVFSDTVGATRPLLALNVVGNATLTGNVSTLNAQSFSGSLTLAAATTLTKTSSVNGINIIGAIDGAYALTITPTAGNVIAGYFVVGAKTGTKWTGGTDDLDGDGSSDSSSVTYYSVASTIPTLTLTE